MLYSGIDLIEVQRIERAVARWHGRFLRRVFTANELAYCGVTATAAGNMPSLAARWAAKEAAAKALGVGVRGIGAGQRPSEDVLFTPVSWHDLEVQRAPAGRPLLVLHGSAATIAAHLGIIELSLSLSHTRDHAIASVVAFAPHG